LNVVKFVLGWLAWHIRAFGWYLTLGFRLYFAIGLDRDFHPGREQDMSRHFKYQREKTYRKYLRA